MSKNSYITASDIGDYVYCHRAWWLRLRGMRSHAIERLNRDSEEHERFAASIARVEKWKPFIITAVLISLILIMLIIGYLLFTYG